MNLILTHEQADFDALAALFAASLVQGGLPVLPRRSNRNVRAFITLYGVEFPFIDPRDLPQAAIDCVTLVDTQSLVTLKGMSKQTSVNVYDHHPLRNLPKSTHDKVQPIDWNVTLVELGATTTYFVEILRDRGEQLNSLQASLLLLGIYEDTGTLTYSHTTARDAHAVAWLFDQGAELRIVTNFLNQALSTDQRELYDRLVAGIETLEINGHKIMLAVGQAGQGSDEISSLAHKLRDLFDPDALFVLVESGEGLRLVARSSTDRIDVSAVAAHFGGGGHERAAAALIRSETAPKVGSTGDWLQSVRVELIDILPRFVRPAITVAQLMSKRPHLLEVETPVQEAARLMARYGYEGFPVLADGNVVGLLTRRSVDRAISHRLNLTAASLMDAGTFHAHVGDSIQRLQALMAESGWGQVPVLDAENKKVIGIVTRTDVLKVLSRGHLRSTQYRSLSDKMEKLMLPQRLALVRAVAEEASNLHLAVFMVGGFVRDLLLGRPSLDFDMVVEGDAIALGQGLAARFGGKLTTHSRFGTAKWYTAGSQLASPLLPEFVDLISARQEYYEHPSALPSVEHGSIKLDLQRRDFTINTLALRLDGRHFGDLHDYYGGAADIKRRLVRVLHSLSFVDDPTRMLRAVRYEQRYDFEIQARSLQLMDEARPLLARLSEERLRHELDLVLVEEKAARMLARLDQLGLLKAIAAELPWSDSLQQRLERGLRQALPSVWAASLQADSGFSESLAYCLWLAGLSLADVEALHVRLRFPMQTLKAVRATVLLQADLPGLAGAVASAWVERLANLPALAIYAVYLISAEQALATYIARWQYIHPHSNGDSLIARGLKPGPAFEEILRKLRAAWLDGALTSEQDEENYLDELLK